MCIKILHSTTSRPPFTKNSRLWGSVSTTAYQKLYNAKIAFRWCVSRCPHPATPIHTFSRPQASAFEEGNNSSGVCRFTFCGAHFFAPASFRSHQIKGGNVGGGNKFESKLLTRLLSLTTLHLLFHTNSNMYPTKPITPLPPEIFIFCKNRPTSSDPEFSAGNSARAVACFSTSVPSALLTA